MHSAKTEDYFLEFINERQLLSPAGKIILAVSGGIDSVVMAHLFFKSNLQFAIAHCNFKLRGEESEQDELFVKNLAQQFNVTFFSTSFETRNYSAKKGISIQMSGRELRYEWLEKVRQENGYDKIAVAHHRNDAIETLLLNLVRGTGISGLHGIKVLSGNIIRPLLFLYKSEIEGYAMKNNISYRTDSSNIENDYYRNKIRNQVIPLLKEINPAVEETLYENIRRFSEAEKIYLYSMEEKKRQLIKESNSKGAQIEIAELKKLEPLRLYLYELLKGYNFNPEVCKDIEEALDGISGKRFYSKTHQLLKDRNTLIIEPFAKAAENEKIKIAKGTEAINYPLPLIFNIIPASEALINKDKNTAFLDADELEWPLVLRKWKEGDSFVPLGMNSKKKLSDFFIDKKLSLHQKEQTWLLFSGNDIAWVIGLRISDKFKVTSNSGNVLVVKYQSE